MIDLNLVMAVIAAGLLVGSVVEMARSRDNADRHAFYGLSAIVSAGSISQMLRRYFEIPPEPPAITIIAADPVFTCLCGFLAGAFFVIAGACFALYCRGALTFSFPDAASED